MYNGYLATPNSQRSSIAPEYTRRAPSPGGSSVSSKDASDRPNSRMLTRRPVSGQSIASIQQQHHLLAAQPHNSPPALHRTPSNSALSIQSGSTSRLEDDDTMSEMTTSSLESKVAKEGWILKKNSLMQWKSYYGVAKHGNAIKPGSLSLYKDEKLISHHQTFDMSEVVEVEPRAQQYYQNIKYEFRMLVKREDTVFATEDPQERKDWVAALTAIMGKVSLASQSELKNRVSNAENMTRGLQSVASELEIECSELQRQLQDQEEEFMIREQKLREQWLIKEKGLKRDLEDSQRAFKTRTELLERELSIWKGKCTDLEKRGEMTMMKKTSESQFKLQQAEDEAKKWKTKATDLEATNELLLRQYHRAESLVAQSKVEGLRMDGKLSFEQAAIKDAVNEMRLDLSKLTNQMRNSESESQPLDRKLGEVQAEVTKIGGAIMDSKKEYEELNSRLDKLISDESESTKLNNSESTKLLKNVHKQIEELKTELIGEQSDEEKIDSAVDVSTTNSSISRKFDTLMQLVETLHGKKVKTDSDRSKEMANVLESIQKAAEREMLMVEDVQKATEKVYEDISNKYDSLSLLVTQNQEKTAQTLSYIELALKDAKDNHNTIKADDLDKIYRKVRDSQAQISDVLAGGLQKMEDSESKRAHEQEKSLSVLSQLFQHVANQIDNSAIPDLPDYVRQMDEMLDRLSETELRLTEIAQAGSMQSMSVAPRDKTGVIAPIPSSQSNEIVQMLHNTRSFMERTLRVLDKFGGSSHGFEQMIKTIIKQSLPATETYNIAKKSNDMSPILDEKLKRYEDNARSYLDKSMDGMRNHLEDYTGVMYKMIEDLVLRAMEHLGNNREKESFSNYSAKDTKSINTDQLDTLIEMQTKLAANKQVLEADIKRLTEEKKTLSLDVRQLQKEMKDLQEQLMEGKAEFYSLQKSTDHINQTLARFDNIGPLLKQLSKLQLMSESSSRYDHDSEGDSHSSEEYVNVERDQIALPKPNKTRSVSPTPSQHSGPEASSWMQRKAAYHTPPPIVPNGMPQRTPNYESALPSREPSMASKSMNRNSRYEATELPESPKERSRLNMPFNNLAGRRRGSSPSRPSGH
ncbi:hypothetical protein INT43_006425 [Umbelopsis isabellina]|uniref:PH domain-containing protein n=1 Tax=Mortierella isabellina TaxID=91625 RepID=A0A8H7PZ68_MORIS|nr:hypothetical protein INT43_006425 [Umbelopsis isabellina]